MRCGSNSSEPVAATSCSTGLYESEALFRALFCPVDAVAASYRPSAIAF